jgi:hypothetical protein
MRTYYIDFTLDSGKKVEVEWSYDNIYGEINFNSIWDDTSDIENEIILTAHEEERLEDMVFNLDPFPPH